MLQGVADGDRRVLIRSASSSIRNGLWTRVATRAASSCSGEAA
jgi:hypothetical protein